MIGLLGITVEVAGRTITTTAGDTFPQDVSPRLTSYEHTIVATGGFESCTLAFVAEDVAEALTWADRLFSAVTCRGPDVDVIWRGRIHQVTMTVAGRTRSYSLDGVANRVRCRYTTVLGTPGVTAATSNAASIALYGVRDAVLSLGTTSLAGAQALRDAYLADRAFPRGQGATTLETSSAGGGVEVTLACVGLYYTLDQVVLERTDTATEATTAQIATLISGISLVNALILNALATPTPADGVLQTRKIEADTTYRTAIEQRLGMGNTSGRRYAWGVYEDGALLIKVWAPNTGGARRYQLRLADSVILTDLGAPVELWQARPDIMAEDADLISLAPPSGAVESPSSFYVERVTFGVDTGGMRLSLEPSDNTNLTARLARVS